MGKDEELYKAAGSGDVAAIRRLVAQGANVNWRNRKWDGWTPLHYAACNGGVEAVRALLDAGALIEAEDKWGWTPLHRAAWSGGVEAVRALLDAGALIEAKDEGGETPLHKAAYNGRVEAVRALLDVGALIETKDKDGWTPLHYAAGNGGVEAVRALLDAGALVEAKDLLHGRTPLHSAAYNGRVGAVRALLDVGALIEAKDKDGRTPLHAATGWGQAEATRALLDAGAHVAVKNKDGRTPLDDAWVGSKCSGQDKATRIAAVKEVIRAAADRKQEKLERERKERESVLAAQLDALRLQQQEEARRRDAEAAALRQREEALRAKERELEAQRQRLAQQMAVPLPPPAALPAAPCPAGPPMYQGGRVSLGAELINQVAPLNSRLVQAGLAAAGQVVQGVLTCNPVTLVAACAMLVKAVNAEVEAVQYCKQRVGRVLVRCGAMVPALQKLEQVLVPPQSASLEASFVQSMSKTLVMLAQVLMGLEQLLVKLQGGSGSRLARMMRALKGQCYQQELDELEQELRDCLSQLMAIIGICSFTKQVSDALVGKEELQVARWAEQNSEDRKADLQQLEAQVLAVAGGVQALQRQLDQQALELDGQRVALQDVLGWLQRMHASSTVIAGHLQHLHRKVDSIQDDVSTMKDQMNASSAVIAGKVGSIQEQVIIIKDQLEKVMLQGRKKRHWSPTDHLPYLAIPASRINANAVRQAMDEAAAGAFGKVVKAKLDGVSEVAVKVFNYKLSGARDCKEAVKEAVLLSMANHPQVVRCFGLVFDPESGDHKSIHGSLVMEWVGGGTLYKLLQEEEEEVLGLRERAQLALQVAAGLQHLHSKKLVHGDLKPQNVLVTELLPNQRIPQAKICDFGLSKYTSSSMLSTHTSQQAFAQAYTPLYTSPQRLGDYAIRTPADDVYAFGIMLHFIATSTTPMDHIPLAELRQAVIDGKRPDIDNWAAEAVSCGAESQEAVRQYCQLAKDCWSPDETLRPDSSTILQRLRELALLLNG